jgi:cytolysin (calcineurin-like family phosphatase)
MALTLSAAAITAMAGGLDALGTLLNGGAVRLYDRFPPATADTAVTTQPLLATVTFTNPAFGAAVAGVITANAMTDESDAWATGTASWFRAVTSGGDPVCDGSVGTRDADCLLSTTSIVAHNVVTMTSCVLSSP